MKLKYESFATNMSLMDLSIPVSGDLLYLMMTSYGLIGPQEEKTSPERKSGIRIQNISLII